MQPSRIKQLTALTRMPMWQYTFKDLRWLDCALTHSSAVGGVSQAQPHADCHESHNERLEFLGDAVLELIISQALFVQYPGLQEGQLTRMRAHLVNKTHLAALARQLQLGRFMRLGEGEEKSGGRARPSVLANALEAVLGALYVDGGWHACQAQGQRWFGAGIAKKDMLIIKDPKSRLQEYRHAQGKALPVYQLQSTVGKMHHQVFTVVCTLPDAVAPRRAPALAQWVGRGASRRQAEQAAAQACLATMTGQGDQSAVENGE